MNNKIFKLIKSELKRLLKYKIFTVGLVVSFIWILIIALIEKEEIEPLLPLLIGMDASIMSIILLAASFYFEKQEGTIKTILVAPVKLIDVLIAKVTSVTIMSLISAFLVAISVLLIHKIEINLLLLFIYIVIIVVSHGAISFTITLFTKDFGSMMGLFGSFVLISFIPAFLIFMNLIPQGLDKILLISPFQSSELLLKSLITKTDLVYVIIALIYLILLGAILYKFVVYKKFKKYVMEG